MVAASLRGRDLRWSISQAAHEIDIMAHAASTIDFGGLGHRPYDCPLPYFLFWKGPHLGSVCLGHSGGAGFGSSGRMGDLSRAVDDAREIAFQEATGNL